VDTLPTYTDTKYVRHEALKWITDPVAPGRFALNGFSGDEDLAFVSDRGPEVCPT